ncbi:hypothetical protein BH10PSE17_BH10PSE17_21600 [soil metagenome]
MYIIAIGWGFVVVLMAAAEAMTTTIGAGLLTLFFYGVVPMTIFVYLFGRRRRAPASGASFDTRSGARDEGADATGDAIAPIREEPVGLVDGAKAARDDLADTGTKQP